LHLLIRLFIFYIFFSDILSCITTSFRVSEDMPLYDILNEFQKGHSHIAVVYKDNEKKEVSKKGKGGEQLEFKDSCKKHRGKSEASPNKGEKCRKHKQKDPVNNLSDCCISN
jgi:hypothetical protein